MTVLRRLLRLAGHGLLFALCLELAARLDDRLTHGAPLLGTYEASLLVTTDSAGLRRNVPGASFQKWRINSLGFRGPETPLAKPAGFRRVVCLGQSETFGLYETEGAEWPAQLGRLLSASHRQVEVINASAVGPGRSTRLEYLSRYVVPLRPDVVVVYPSVLLDAFGLAEPAPAPQPPVGWRPASRAWPKITQRLRQAVPAALADPLRCWLVERRVRRLEARARSQGRAPLDALPDAEVAGFEAHLRDVTRLLQAHGIAPVLATYPTLGDESNLRKYRLQVAHQRTWGVALSELGLVSCARALNGVTRRVAAEERLALADAEAAVPRDTRHFGDYVHYTDAGARLVARCVAEALAGAGLLDRSGDP